MAGRTRPVKLTLRLSHDEHDRLLQKVAAAHMSQQDYLLKCALQKKIVVMEGFTEVAWQLKKIGGNINQLAHHANEGDLVNDKELQIIQEELLEIWQLLKQCGRTAASKK